jgi:hypothetical protein
MHHDFHHHILSHARINPSPHNDDVDVLICPPGNKEIVNSGKARTLFALHRSGTSFSQFFVLTVIEGL